MAKSTSVDKEVIERFFYKYVPIVEDALEQNAIPTEDIKALCGNFFDLLKREDPVSKQIVEVTFGYLASLH